MEKIIEMENFIKNSDLWERMYDAVRVVDPVKKIPYMLKDNRLEENEDSCYSFWKQNTICANCISMRAFNEEETYVKIEFNGKKVYLVTAVPLLTDKGKMVAEFLQDVTDKGIIEGIDLDNAAEVYQKINRLNDMLVKDELTGVYNRRFIKERLDVEIFRAVTYAKPLAVIMADIDFFKKVNDTYGHMAGDEVLKKFARILQENVRGQEDWVARYGGEEFIICLPNTGKDGAFTTAERIRKEVAEAVVSYKEQEIRITASFGIAVLEGETLTGDDLIRKADENLYKAKNAGRNRVVCC
ncbi:diguanylate cyclase (GGDEF) domain-containing protein [Thermosyntropha lipolytica DSM 11003]|uniref:Diguanylate cyclase (GGDEF) domain-containing protein n=1 Tax=Thermosyntropha lipolytica DSM 11003 TaxID=1123382 RepID=A0A1M5QJX1_9FIRM|nr:GGDEF domain-containing protein [Thermosyntropha lipolytica]SHH14387.1 diguanylate cyclase (GGDEF) domain-containing protein [Thermosyntropha lipolytica DSM 11003]